MRSTIDVSSLGGEPDPLLTRLEVETLQAMSADWHAGRRVGAEEYLKRHPEFEIRKDIDHKLMITVAPDGWLKRVR